jgi:dCMP deaminase
MPHQYEIDKVFMERAQAMSQLSKCKLYKVGCEIVRDRRPISTGYNGSVSGFKHCCEHEMTKEEHHIFSEKFTIHAEQNALLFAAKHGISVDECTIYSTLQPCKQCLKLIAQSGITRIVYRDLYDKACYDDEVYEMLDVAGVVITQFSIR